jgi:hypothetical protein
VRAVEALLVFPSLEDPAGEVKVGAGVVTRLVDEVASD